MPPTFSTPRTSYTYQPIILWGLGVQRSYVYTVYMPVQHIISRWKTTQNMCTSLISPLYLPVYALLFSRWSARLHPRAGESSIGDVFWSQCYLGAGPLSAVLAVRPASKYHPHMLLRLQHKSLNESG